ncbi:MAG: dTDP-4-dehydrorhamnose 3,5-epimerase [Rickettsiales bacterium]|nr:dTDP-4-dehydrorhamnose 3,5-epimerase [Rickettsiales bacterium]
MQVLQTSLADVLVFEPEVYKDDRGLFLEQWRRSRYRSAGIDYEFVQDNLSRSSRGTIRGLHYQEPNAQGKLVTVLRGAAFDVAVDIRVGSPTFKRWFEIELNEENRRQIWIPPGFAHGFCALADPTDIFYKTTAVYSASDEYAIKFDDPDIGIRWPVSAPTLSDRDLDAPLISNAPLLPLFSEST